MTAFSTECKLCRKLSMFIFARRHVIASLNTWLSDAELWTLHYFPWHLQWVVARWMSLKGYIVMLYLFSEADSQLHHRTMYISGIISAIPYLGIYQLIWVFTKSTNPHHSFLYPIHQTYHTYHHLKQWNEITHRYHTFIGRLTQLLLKEGHLWVLSPCGCDNLYSIFCSFNLLVIGFLWWYFLFGSKVLCSSCSSAWRSRLGAMGLTGTDAWNFLWSLSMSIWAKLFNISTIF